MDSLSKCVHARVCNFCCMLLMGMSWLLNESEMRQFAPQRIMLSSAWAATHVLDNSQASCSHRHSALLCNYCVLVLSPLNVTMCALEQRLVKREERALGLGVHTHLKLFVLFGTKSHVHLCIEGFALRTLQECHRFVN